MSKIFNRTWLKPLRVVISLCFILGFIVLFSDIKAKIPSGTYVLFGYFQFLPSLLKFIGALSLTGAGFMVILVLTSFFGRVYCSTICPLGVLQDILGFVRKKVKGKKARYKYSKPLNYWRYGILGIAALSLFFTGIFLINILDPYANFGRIASDIYQPVFIGVSNLASKILPSVNIYSLQPVTQKAFHVNIFLASLTVLILLVVLVYYKGRIYCNTVCPVGTILGLLSRFSFFKIRIDQSSCIQCGKCQLVCKANCINIKEMKVDESRCVACYNCIPSCESLSIGYKYTLSRKPENKADIEDPGKRNFLKASALLLIASSGISKSFAQEHSPQSDFDNRGTATPPGSMNLEHFKDKCVACQLCVSSCPGKVLQPSFLQYGITGMMLPYMDYDKGFCNYECTKCGEVCPTGAIHALTKKEKKTSQIGVVKFVRQDCVVVTKNKSCGSCSEHCPTQAVHMVPYKGALTIPATNPDICIGCGACEHVCPAEPRLAIYVVANEAHKVAKEPVSEKIEVKETEEFPF